ncbi:MAG: hypothetical protein IT195_04300 [Microthrixaceae bacterium]|nr:hypothetical protein [Microthrixaceae bacterium]
MATGSRLIDAELTAYRLRLPLHRPLCSAHGVERVRELIVVAARLDDDTVGWGECPTLGVSGYSRETTERAWAALCGGAALGPMAAGAVADARLDAWLRAERRSLAEFLGAGSSVVATSTVVDLGGDIPDGGFVKWKVTPETARQVGEFVSARGERGCAVDANGSFSEVHEVVAAFGGLPLAYVEQPLAAGSDADLALVVAQLDVPVALDESVDGMEALYRLASLGAMSVISLKPARVGGVEVAASMFDEAGRLGVGVFVGGMWESGIGRATALALAARDGVAFPADLGPTGRYLADDLCPPLVSEGGSVVLPEGPGIGVVPDPDRLARYTIATSPLPVL